MTGEGGDSPRHTPLTDAERAYEEALRQREIRMCLLRAFRSVAEKHAGTKAGECLSKIGDDIAKELSVGPGGRA